MLVLVLACAVFASGCSLMPGATFTAGRWLPDGALGLSRPVPPARPVDARASLAPQMFEAETRAESPQLIVSRRDRSITAIRPGEAPIVIKADGAQYLREGSFSITSREVAPLWYAPTQYFRRRGMPVPAEGSRERYKRAALGSHALYLNNQLPIHSGPIWMEEIGGIRLPENDMAQLFSLATVGMRLDVR
jgi:hypothetical protein